MLFSLIKLHHFYLCANCKSMRKLALQLIFCYTVHNNDSNSVLPLCLSFLRMPYMLPACVASSAYVLTFFFFHSFLHFFGQTRWKQRPTTWPSQDLTKACIFNPPLLKGYNFICCLCDRFNFCGFRGFLCSLPLEKTKLQLLTFSVLNNTMKKWPAGCIPM